MKPLIDLHTADDNRLIVLHTSDDKFERPAILISPEKDEILSMDIMLQYKGIYQIARLNIAVNSLETGGVNIDICLPDKNKMDVLQWKNGARVVDIHNTNNNLSLVIKPGDKFSDDHID